MSSSAEQDRGLAHGVVGRTRVIAFGTSIVAPAGSVVAGLVVPSGGWAYTYNSRGLGPTAGFLTGWMMVSPVHCSFRPVSR
jgi:amino acid transporter